MARPKPTPKTASGAGDTGDLIEEKVVAFAAQLGLLVGSVQAKADGWLDRNALGKEIGRIRDSAAALLEQVSRESTPTSQTDQNPSALDRLSRGPVDAPGKRHRKPPPQEPINKRMGEPTGKQMGQKNAKTGRRGGRG
jgi:hypothetical protein